MPSPSTILPILADDRPLRLTPTGVSQFIRLEQCERFLRVRLAEWPGRDFVGDYDVVPQRVTPLLSLSGHGCEKRGGRDLAGRSRSVHDAARDSMAHNRPESNQEMLDEARRLRPGESVLLFQPRLVAEIDGWRIWGHVDLLRLVRSDDPCSRWSPT